MARLPPSDHPWIAAWQRAAIEVVTLSLATPAAGRRIQRPRREQWNLYWLRAGSIDLELTEGACRLDAGMAALVPPGAAFTEAVRRDASYAVLDLRVRPVAGGGDPLRALAPTMALPVPVRPAAAALADLAAAWRRQASDPLARLELRPPAERLLLLAVRARLAAGPPTAAAAKVPDWLRRLRREALERAGSAPPSVARLAARAGCSASHLAHQWRRHYGIGIIADLRRERLAGAALQLQAEPALPVAAVARSWGWADAKHFSRDFARRFGAPPQRWRSAQVPVQR